MRDEQLSKGWGQIVTPLEFKTRGGRQKINCANAENIFRIIQAIPKLKVEPFKSWLEKELMQEIDNSQGMKKLKSDAKAGGDIAGGAREKLEKRLGKSVVSDKNYLKNLENKKLK